MDNSAARVKPFVQFLRSEAQIRPRKAWKARKPSNSALCRITLLMRKMGLCELPCPAKPCQTRRIRPRASAWPAPPRRRPRRRLTAAPRPTILAGMDPYQAASLAASQMAAWAAVASAGAAAVAAVGIWIFGIGMMRSNARRSETEKDRHEQIMASFKDAAEDRKAALEQAAEDRKAIAEQMARQTEQAAEDRKAIAEQMARQAEQAAEDRKAIAEQVARQAEQAAEDRKSIAAFAQATLHAAQATSEDRQRVLEALKDQSTALQVLIAPLLNPDSPRDPSSKWAGPPRPGPAA